MYLPYVYVQEIFTMTTVMGSKHYALSALMFVTYIIYISIVYHNDVQYINIEVAIIIYRANTYQHSSFMYVYIT